MIAVMRATDKNTGKAAPLVILTLGAEDLITTSDTGATVPAIGLDVASARYVAGMILAMANEIEAVERVTAVGASVPITAGLVVR